MKIIKYLAAILLCATSGIAIAEPTGQLKDWVSKAEDSNFKGSVLVAKGNQVLLKRGFGVADRENARSFSANTVFDILSVTKQFTASAILKLEEKGLLSVNDTVSRFFKDVPDDKKNITIHHLLTHTSGLQTDFKEDYEVVSREDLIKGAWRSTLEAKPGARYQYSNLGYSLLGIIIEKVSKTSYEKFLRENLFLPAGMQDTGYKIPKWDPKNLVSGYDKDVRWGTALDHEWAEDGPWWNLKANGGLLSTLSDLHRWHVALKGSLILSEQSKAKLFSPYVAEDEEETSFYGYGWTVSKTSRDTRLIAHNGGNPYFFSDFRRYVDEDVLILFATNEWTRKNFKMYRDLRKTVFSNLDSAKANKR